ncbi:MAG: SusC/RagA family TonB-linked outer membrane protein [Mangrovibacterium sp.]
MKKNGNMSAGRKCVGGLSVLIMMRLTVFVLCMSVFSSIASGTYSQNTKISLDLRKTSIQNALKEIENTTNYLFLYNNNLINVGKIVDVRVNNREIEDVLDLLFAGEEVKYVIMDRQVIITPKEAGVVRRIQQALVTGTVRSSTGELLPGVTVLVKGTTTGTITDFDGRFSLPVGRDDVLIFSFVGMRKQEIPVAGLQVINVTMLEEELALDEVIVIGYGTARRGDYTGSVSSVKMENSPIALAPNMNALEALKGNVSGLNIGATNSAGGDPSMLIRGQNSISGSNDPLIVLDGVIYMGSLNDINPNDIASFDILKDAVSSAAYGSRASNGIIAITTRKGRSTKPQITFNTSAGIQLWQNNKPDLMSGEKWISSVNARNGYNEGSTDWMKPGELENLEAGNETDWLDEVTRTGVIQDYQLSVAGAAKGVNYYLSTSYNKNKGVVEGDEFERISVLGKVNAEITDWLSVGVDGSFSRRDYSGFAANLESAQKMSPYGVMYRDDQGNLEKYPYTQSMVNPLWGVDDGTTDNRDIRRNYRLNSYLVVDVPWIKGLNFRMNYLLNYDQNESGSFYYEDYYIAEGSGLERYAPATVQLLLAKANGSLNHNTTNSWVWDNILTYRNTFGKHSVEATLVATRDELKYNIMYVTGSDFAANGNTALGLDGLHMATVQKVDLYVNDGNINNSQIGGYERSNIGYLGRISYSFNDKYYLTGSYRRDGASVFGVNNKWGNFAAVGAAWKISEEDFMESVEPLDFLKLKLAWGQNGNQGLGPYGTLSRVANGPAGGYRYEFSDSPATVNYGLVQSTLGNAELGWESTDSWNIGFESVWLKNRLFADLDVYFSRTTDQIFTRTIPVMNGFKTVYASMGQVNNTGVELTLRSVNIQESELNWTTGLTFWKNNNKLKKLYGEDLDGDGREDDDIGNSLFIGKSLGAIYGYKQDGIVQEDDAEYMALTGASPGSPKYMDMDGVSGITADDRTIVGYTKENFRLNMSNTLRYKNFEFYMLITGIFGGNNRYKQVIPTSYARDLIYVDNWANDMRNSDIVFRRHFIGNVPSSPYYLQSVPWGEIYSGSSDANTNKNNQSLCYPVSCKIATDRYTGLEDGENRSNLFRDEYIIRLSETILLRAEAKQRMGNKPGAAADVNLLRERARCEYMVTADDMDDDFRLILDERARELVYEECRWNTLLRMGGTIAVDRIREYAFWPETEATLTFDYNLWPIPQTVIDTNKDITLAQNPGWENR